MTRVAFGDPAITDLLDRYKGRLSARVAEEDGGRFTVALDVDGKFEIASIDLRATTEGPPVSLYVLGASGEPASIGVDGGLFPLPEAPEAPQTATTMTLEQFRATGRDVADLGDEFGDMGLDGTAGRVYLYKGGAYIERWEDDRHGVAPPNGPTWLLTLGRDQYDGDLAKLEELLFEWCRDEGFFEQPLRA